MAAVHDPGSYSLAPLPQDAEPPYPPEHDDYLEHSANPAEYQTPVRSGSNSKSYASRASARPNLFVETSPPEETAAESHSPPLANDLYTAPSASTAPVARKGSVSDRSPLQHLEVKLGDISKEEKRARIEQAEQLARQNSEARRAPANWASTRQATQEALLNAPLDSSTVPATNQTQRQTHESDQISAPPEPDPATPTAPYNFSKPRVRSYGYDSSLTGGAAAAAIGAYQASRRRNYESRTPVVAARSTAPDASSWTQRLPAQPLYTGLPSDGRQIPEQPGISQQQTQDESWSEVPPPAEFRDTTIPYGANSLQHPQLASAPTATNQPARKQVAFMTDNSTDPSMQPGTGTEHRRFRDVLRPGNNPQARRYEPARSLDEWTHAETATLTSADLDFDSSSNTANNKAWWERTGTETNNHSNFGSSHIDNIAGTTFKPPLHLRCGPLLRYTGIHLDPRTEKEFWKGSVMIVTHDSISSYEAPPVLRLFKQSMDLATIPAAAAPPPQNGTPGTGPQMSTTTNFDPIAGLPKMSRTGQTLYAKHVHLIDGELDLSQMETDEGLFSHVAPPQDQYTFLSRIHSQDGESLGRFREVKAVRLHADRGVTFWRFNLQIELGAMQNRIAYRINGGPAIGFWVPASGQAMNIMFHSCNGFSLNVNPNEFSGPDPLWRDVLNTHQIRPFHCMIGGGDQIYNDAAMRQTRHFQDWLAVQNPLDKHSADFSVEMQSELEQFYLDRYAMWFSQGFFGVANSQIPMINIWDDHDIIDGFGSYPHHFMSTPVFTGLGAVAFKYYLLFQHQSVVDETEETEPSWLLGAAPGPYIHQRSRSIFVSLGKGIKLLGLDCRTERMRDEVLSQETYDLVFDRCRQEINMGETRHLLVLVGVPIAYPRLNFLENILTSRAMDPIKALGRAKLLGGFVNKFDGSVELLDDLDDHWTAKHHKQERNWFIQELQELASEKSVRITILGGDVHLAAVGQFYSNPKLGITKDHDHRYMPNIISSAIVNTPPPEMMGDILNKRNKVHHLDNDTDEDMMPIFLNDVTGRSRNNHHLLPRRNWCSIREYYPGSTPPPTPPPEENEEGEERPARRRSFSFSRSRSRNSSLSRGDGEKRGFLRRISTRRGPAPPSSYHAPNTVADDGSYNSSNQDVHSDDPLLQAGIHDRDDLGAPIRASEDYATEERGRQPLPRSFSFQRRPTRLSRRSSKSSRSGRDDNINLDGGLDIILNCEINQRDPAGYTMPYRLVVPALAYRGPVDDNPVQLKGDSTGRVGGFLGSFTRNRSRDERRDLDTEAVPYSSHEVRSTPPLGGRAMPESVLAGHRPLNQPNGEVLEDRDLPSGQPPPPFKGAVPTPLEDPSSSYSQQISAPGPESERDPVSFATAPLGISSIGALSDMPTRASSNRETGARQMAPLRRHSASGPPPPSNIDELPASVRKRYSELNASDGNEYPQAADSSRKRYSQMNDPAGYKRYSQFEPLSRSQPPPQQRYSAPLPPPKPEDTHRRYSSAPMEMPLLPTNINQLRSSTHRTLQSVDLASDESAPQRSVSGPAAASTSTAFGRSAPVTGNSSLHTRDVSQMDSSNHSQYYGKSTTADELPARSNTYHGVPSSTAVAPSMVPLSRGQAKRDSGIPSYPSPLTSHAPQKDQYEDLDDPPTLTSAPAARNAGAIAPASTTQPRGREYDDEAYGYRNSGDAGLSRQSWGYSHAGMPEKVARHFGGYDGAASGYDDDYYDSRGRPRKGGIGGMMRRLSESAAARRRERRERRERYNEDWNAGEWHGTDEEYRASRRFWQR